MPLPITASDIRREVGSTTYSRGKAYFDQGRVRRLQTLESLTGVPVFESEVLGSGGRVYQQTVELLLDEWDELTIEGSCSCPMDYNCKHVAAACLAYREQIALTQTTSAPSRETASVVAWLRDLADQAASTPGDTIEERLTYVLVPPPPDLLPFNERSWPRPVGLGQVPHGARVELRVCRPRKNGKGLTKGRGVGLDSLFLFRGGPYLQASDWEIAPLLNALGGMHYYGHTGPLLLEGTAAHLALRKMVATGRCHWASTAGPPLAYGEPRRLQVAWAEAPDKGLRLTVSTEPSARLLPTEPPTYLDADSNTVGQLEAPGINGAQLKRLFNAPTVSEAQAEEIGRVMLRDFPTLSLPTPRPVSTRENRGATPIPCLRLFGMAAPDNPHIHAAALDFLYAEDRVPALPSGPQSLLETPTGLVRVERDPATEDKAIFDLFSAGFAPLDSSLMRMPGPLLCYMDAPTAMLSASRWSAFLQEQVPQLEAEGWRIETDDSFLLRFDPGEWSAALDEPEGGGNDWFGLRFDLELDGERLPLLPLIAPLLELDPEQPLPDRLSVPLDSPDESQSHRYVDLPTERLRPFLVTLRELYDRAPPNADGELRLSRFDAATLNDLEATGTRLHGGTQLRELAARLADFEGITRVEPPRGLATQLRHYQRQGLDWLQFLREYRFGGILADETHFRRYWRTPIEAHGDRERQARLARRVAPFMLRRRKQDVLKELPPKTEIIRSIPLHKDQAALYESIRLSMEKRVRDAIAAQGLARSHITILDALLKLRQTCCHPSLLSLAAASTVKHSAKLDLLMEMLPEQLEEGRRILLFSQFTTMLGLIEEQLARRGIAYTKLTGQTRKREEAIDRFRSGEVAVFLISLKAGGVGLNLTEADTVILYDPWWNPAVETQAADRAHRIGQDKPVFVYKLMTEETVEERILALQEKKQALAEGIYRKGEAQPLESLTAEDLQGLFAPTDSDR